MCPFPSTEIAIISFPLYLPYRNVASIRSRGLQNLKACIEASNAKKTRRN
ncbi:hypothetical protein Syun_005113 [Stephania yunnanensis]|uniref:Uncharacterized protein n=1 Tax=Stephania yunnanensis TaxID=152371 RepID=A0AAP0L4I5_9MAGN